MGLYHYCNERSGWKTDIYTCCKRGDCFGEDKLIEIGKPRGWYGYMAEIKWSRGDEVEYDYMRKTDMVGCNSSLT